MSQAKVDHNKELKKNRKKIVKRQKMERTVSRTILAIIIVAAIGFVGYSGYGVYEKAHEDDPIVTNKVDISAVTDYLGTVGSDEDK